MGNEWRSHDGPKHKKPKSESVIAKLLKKRKDKKLPKG